MDENSVHSKFEELRCQAEGLLKDPDRDKTDQLARTDILHLIHELEVHQVELQIQNEELRRAKQELEQSRKEYSELYHFAPAGYITLDTKGIVVNANRTALHLLGLSKDKVIGRGFSHFVHIKDQSTYLNIIKATIKGAQGSEELRLLRGDEIFHARVNNAPSLSDSGQFNGWRLVFTDIDDLKRAQEELKSYADKLERSNRELQNFAFTASHDLQEPLRKVQAFANLLNQKFSSVLGEEGSDYLDRMSKAARRMQEMVLALLNYSRIVTKGEGFVPVDLGRTAQGVTADMDWQIEKSGAEVVIEDLPTVEADPNQMRQLFQNLIANALKFHGEKRSFIRIYSIPAPSEESEEEAWQIFVEDNGIGFDEKYLERIFSLFERLHGRSEYEGTGMGLAICRRIAERHRGAITARSTLGEGATFIITLPSKQLKAA